MPRRCLPLWVRAKPAAVRNALLSCFDSYPYFHESYRQYGVELPSVLRVVYRPVDKYVRYALEDESSEDWVREVMDRIRSRDTDIPPVLLDRKGELLDGRHRAWAARLLGLRTVPTTTVRFP